MLEILVSTDKENIEAIVKKFKDYNLKKTFIWQTYKNPDINFNKDLLDSSIEIYKYNEKGLSKSRNRAIEVATEDICLLADDDIEYKKNFKEIILEAFEKNPDYDIITFQIEKPDGKLFKKYPNKKLTHNIRTIMKVSSIEIAFKRESIQKANLKFDEKFGLGGLFPTGEEAIFLSDALKKGLKILYIPKPIVIHPNVSSGFKFSRELIEAKGAMFYRIFNNRAYFISFLFALKKYKEANISLAKFYKHMLNGIYKYKMLSSYNQKVL